MSPPTTVRSSQPAQAGSLLSQLRPAHLIVAVAAIALFVVVTRLLAVPNFIERISFENPTVYDVSIEAAGPDREGWLAIATARREATTAAEEVPDIGDIPEGVGERLRAAGAPPSS